ncbi:hypothetical protein BH18ACT5_BH18ACT5_13890 [soil metagenome]
MIKVALVDDDALIREGLRMIIEQEDDLRVVGQAEDGREALEMVRRSKPDVVLMDIRMPVLDGLAATAAITGSDSPSRVVILTTFEIDEYVFEALRAGASGLPLEADSSSPAHRRDQSDSRRRGPTCAFGDQTADRSVCRAGSRP